MHVLWFVAFCSMSHFVMTNAKPRVSEEEDFSQQSNNFQPQPSPETDSVFFESLFLEMFNIHNEILHELKPFLNLLTPLLALEVNIPNQPTEKSSSEQSPLIQLSINTWGPLTLENLTVAIQNLHNTNLKDEAQETFDNIANVVTNNLHQLEKSLNEAADYLHSEESSGNVEEILAHIKNIFCPNGDHKRSVIGNTEGGVLDFIKIFSHMAFIRNKDTSNEFHLPFIQIISNILSSGENVPHGFTFSHDLYTLLCKYQESIINLLFDFQDTLDKYNIPANEFNHCFKNVLYDIKTFTSHSFV